MREKCYDFVMIWAGRLQNVNYNIPLRLVPWYLARLPRLVAVVVWAVFVVLWLTIMWLVMALVEILFDVLMIIFEIMVEEDVMEIFSGIMTAFVAPIVILILSLFIRFDSCGVAFRYGITEREERLSEERPRLCEIASS